MFKLTLALGTLCACMAAVSPCVGIAQVEATPIPMPTKPDFSTMQFLVGTWNCSTKSARRPAPYIAKVTYTVSSDGWWLDQTTVTNPVPWFNVATTTYDKYTYDSDTKRWIDITYGDVGAYGLATSPGWNGDAMTWHDANFAPTADVKTQTDTVMTKVSDTKLTAHSAFTEASGRVVDLATTCTKAS